MSPRRIGTCLFDSVTALMFLFAAPTFSAVTFAWSVRGVASLSDATSGWTWFACVAAAPLLYVTWLIWCLAVCSIEVQVHCRYLKYLKPARASEDTFYAWRMLNSTLLLYLRGRFVRSLPLIDALLAIQGVRHLVLLSYSGSTHLGVGSLVLGILFDPDLTEVGEGAILGAGTSVVAHSLNVNSNGSRLLVTSTVKIGARSVIGGASQILHGVCIGNDAILEPSSCVAAFTQIGDGEVWGGNPARFIRKRNLPGKSSPECDAIPSGSPLDERTEAELRNIVAHALHRPVEAITQMLSVADTAAWDSLAQLGIAAELQRRFGITLTNQESFRLRSMDSLRDVVRNAAH